MDPAFSPLVFFHGSKAISPSNPIFGLHELPTSLQTKNFPEQKKTSQVDKAILKLASPFGNFKKVCLFPVALILNGFQTQEMGKLTIGCNPLFLVYEEGLHLALKEGKEKKFLAPFIASELNSLTGGALMMVNSLPHLQLPKEIFCLGWPNRANKTIKGQPKGRMISASWHKILLPFCGAASPSPYCHHIPALGEWDQFLPKTSPTGGASFQPRNEIKE